MAANRKRLLKWSAGGLLALFGLVWVLSFWKPFVIVVPGFLLTLNVHSDDHSFMLRRGKLLHGLQGCPPYVSRVNDRFEVFAFGSGRSKQPSSGVSVVVFDRDTRKEMILEPDCAYFFALALGCVGLESRYSSQLSDPNTLVLRYSEPEGGSVWCELIIDVVEGKLINERRGH